jgi:hypothetical protein
MHGILERFYSNGVCDLGAASPLLGMAACASLAAGLVLGASQAHATINYSAVTSTNWAGYVATAPRSQAFTGVVGAWQVPAVTAPPAGSSSGTYSAFWVGLGGFTNGTVEQLGTSSFSTPGNGSYYYAWYEMYPQFSIPIGMAVTPGDWMNASVTYEGGANFRLTMQDTTTGAIFSIDQTSTFDQGQFASSDLRTSAEWIAESPGIGASGTISSLANFGTVTFTGAAATLGGTNTGTISNFTNSAIQLVSGVGGLGATPSPLNGYGNGFTVTTGGAAPTGSQLTITSNSGYHQGMGIKGFATPIPEPGVLPLMAFAGLTGLALAAGRGEQRRDAAI